MIAQSLLAWSGQPCPLVFVVLQGSGQECPLYIRESNAIMAA